MTRFDADSSTVSGETSSVTQAATLTERLVGQNIFVAKLALVFAVMLGASYLVYGLAHTHEIRQLAAIGKWFTVLFASGALGLALVIKTVGAIQRFRSGRY